MGIHYSTGTVSGTGRDPRRPLALTFLTLPGDSLIPSSHTPPPPSFMKVQRAHGQVGSSPLSQLCFLCCNFILKNGIGPFRGNHRAETCWKVPISNNETKMRELPFNREGTGRTPERKPHCAALERVATGKWHDWMYCVWGSVKRGSRRTFLYWVWPE